MADADEIRRNTCPNICKQCRPQCKMWQDLSHLEGRTLMKYIKVQQEKTSAHGGLPHRIEMARPAKSSGGLPSQPKTTPCCGTCDVILEQISMLLDEIWDILGPEHKVQEPCVLGRSGSCPCQHCMKLTSRGYAQGFGPSSSKERYISWLKRLRPILLMVLEGVKRGRHQIYKGEEKDELEKLLEQLRIPLRKQARNIRITSLTNIPLSPTERDAGLVTSLIENTDLLEKVLYRIKSESDIIVTNNRQENSESHEIHGRTGQLTPGNTPTHDYDAEGSVSTAHLPDYMPTHYYDAEGNLKTAHLSEQTLTHSYDAEGKPSGVHHTEYKPTHYIDAAGTIRKAYLPEHKPTHYYDAQAKLRKAHHQEHKPTHYYDEAETLRTAHLSESKPTHYYDEEGTLRTAHLPEYKPNYYDDTKSNRTVQVPEHTKPTHFIDAEGTPRKGYHPEDKPTHYYDKTGTLRSPHLPEQSPTYYYDAEETPRRARLREQKPTHYIDASGTIRKTHLPEHNPTHYYDAEGNLKTAQLPEHKPPHYDAEETPRKGHLPEHIPTHYIDAKGTPRKAYHPEHKPTHYYDETETLRIPHFHENSPTHYIDAEGALKRAYLPEHKPTHYTDAEGTPRKTHLPEHKPTRYYDADGDPRTAHHPEYKYSHYYDAKGISGTVHVPEHNKATHYIDAEGTPRKAHHPEHKPTHYIDAAGTIRNAHLPEHKPTRYIDAEVPPRIAYNPEHSPTNNYYDAEGTPRRVHDPEHKKPTHYIDAEGTPRRAHLPEPSHYIDAAGTNRKAHLPEHKPTHYIDAEGTPRKAYYPEHSPIHYYDAEGTPRRAHLPEHKPTHYIDAAGTIREAHLPEHKPTHYYDAEGNLRTAQIPEHKPLNYDAEGTPRRAHLPEHKPTHNIDDAGTIRKAHLPEHKPTHYYDTEGNLRTAQIPEHKPTHYIDTAGTIRKAHLPEHKPTHYYDAEGNLRTAYLPDHKPPHYDAEGTPRRALLPEHKPTHYIDGAGTVKKAHLPEHKPTHYYDVEGNLRTAYFPDHKPRHYDAEGTSRRAHLPEHKPTHYYDAEGNLRTAHLSEQKPTEETPRKARLLEHKPTHYIDAAGTIRKAHLAEHTPTHYYDAKGNLRTAYLPDHKPPPHYDAEGTPRRAHLPEYKPTHYYDEAGTFRSPHLPEHKPHYNAEGTPRRPHLQEHKPTHYIDAAGTIRNAHLPEHKPTHYYDTQGNLRTAQIPENKPPHYNDVEGIPRKAHLPEHKTAHYYDATNKQPVQKKSALKVLGNDNSVVFPPIFEKTMLERKGDRSGGTKYTKEDKSEQPTGRTHNKKEDEIKLKRGATLTIDETSDKREHRAHFGNTEFAGKDRQSLPVESNDTQSPKTTDSRSHQGILKSRTTKEIKQHVEMERTGKRIVEMNENEQKAIPKGDVQYGGRWPKEPLPSRGDLFMKNTSSEKDLKGIGGAKGHVRTGTDKDHASTAKKEDNVNTASNKDTMTTGSQKNNSRTGSKMNQVRTGRDKGSDKDYEMDGGKTGDEKNRKKTGGKKDGTKTGSEKGHEGGSETTLITQKDTSRKPGKSYYKGEAVAMKDEAEKGDLKVKVLKGGIETKEKIKKVMQHPGKIDDVREVSKTELMSQKKNQASKKDTDVKTKRTIVSEVPSNIILKRIKAEKLNELRLARKEAKMQREPPPKTISIKNLPNVNMLLKKKKKKIRVIGSDSDTGITECTELVEPPEMIQGDAVVPLETIVKHEHTDTEVKPLLFEVEADVKDDEPASFFPSIHALKSTSKMDHTHISDKKQLTLKQFKEKTESPADNKGVIVYKLSNPQFIEMGYTKLPSVTVMRKTFIYKMVQPNPTEDWFRRNIHKRILYYDTCEKLAEIDENGYGCWYYKNGRVALQFSAAERTIRNAHLPEHKPTHYYDTQGNLRTAQIPENKPPHYNDVEGIPRKAHLPEHKTAHYYDATNKQPVQKKSALKVLGNDNSVVFPPIFEKTMLERKGDRSGGTKYTKEDKSEQPTGRTHNKKEDEIKLKRGATLTIDETSDKREHRAHFGNTEFAGKDRQSLPVESNDTQSPKTTDSRSHQGILKSRTTKEIKQHVEMERTGKRIVEMNENEQKAIPKGDVQYGGRWPKEPLPSRGDLFMKNTSSEKDLKGIGGAKGHVRTGTDKDHASTAKKEDNVNTASNKDTMTTGSQKNNSRTGSKMNQVRTGRDKGSDKDYEMDGGKTGDEKNRKKTGGKKDGTKTGSEKGHEGGSETTLITQKDTSRKPGKSYYKGEAVAMKDEAEKGDLKVKVLKGGIETKEKIKKVMQHPGKIDDVREVSKTELMSQKKNQASKKDTDVKTKRTIVSEVPSNIILKRIKAEKLNELRLARKEAKMQREPPPKTISIKNLPNVNMLLKKKKKKIRVIGSDSDTGITECTELVEPPEMIQGDAVVPLETIVKHEHTDTEVKPLLFEVEADVKDDEPSSFFPSIHALKSTSKMDHTHISDKKQLTLKQFKEKTESPADNKGVIVYKLSNPQFIEMGYTKLPSVTVMRKTFIYKMVQPNPTEDWFRRNIHKRILYYDTCEKLAEIDENGYGCWYYKNGRVALQFYAAEQKYAKKRYIIYSSGENDENGKSRGVTVLATFDHVGHGIVYDHRGNMRLKYNQNEGENFDATIGATGRWKWHSMTTTLSAFENVYEEEHMRLSSQSTQNLLQQMAKQGVSSDDPAHHHHLKFDKKEHIHMLTTEMENFMREKKELLQQKFQIFELKLKAFKLNEEFSLRIYEQTKIWLHFNVGCRSLKLNLGLRLISSNVIGTEMVHMNEIYTPFDRDVPESESISNILDIISETRKQNRKRKSGFRKYFPDLKNTASPLGRSR